MRNDIAQALLLNIFKDTAIEEVEDARKYFQTMAKYKYDDYQQFSPGMRFIERLALWLNQFDNNDKMTALNFVRDRLIYISVPEMNLLVSSAYADVIKNFFIQDIALELKIPEYYLLSIVNSIAYKKLKRQALFCGMSDGAKMELFRRANTGIISHEQIYQTYELSSDRASKMQEELTKDLKKMLNDEYHEDDNKFKRVFLLDDFSASGTSYLKVVEENGVKNLKGKIGAFYKSIYDNQDLNKVFNTDELKIYVIIYICTEQAKNMIESNFSAIEKKYGSKPQLICLHIIPNTTKLNTINDDPIIQLCNKDIYYDADELEDEHTKKGGNGVKLGFGNCSLSVVLAHNTPNNSVPLLWSYDTSSKFIGLFPRIPRHKEI